MQSRDVAPLKQGQVQNLSCENEFYLYDNKNNFHKKGFALGLLFGLLGPKIKVFIKQLSHANVCHFSTEELVI